MHEDESREEIEQAAVVNVEPFPPVPEHARKTWLLGLIVEQGAYLEFLASQLAATLIGQGIKRGAIITQRMNLSQVLRLIHDLSRQGLPPDLRERLDDALIAARKGAQKRNGFVHSFWMGTGGDGTSSTYGRLRVNRDETKPGSFTKDDTPYDEIVAALGAVQTAASKIGDVWFEIGTATGDIQ